MGTRENKVETYFASSIKKLGGLVYKWVSPGKRGVPDRIAIVPKDKQCPCCGATADIYFPEIKTEDGVVAPEQTREIVRLTTHGANAYVLFGISDIDNLVEKIKIKKCS